MVLHMHKREVMVFLLLTLVSYGFSQQNNLRMIVSRDVNFSDMLSSSYKMPVTLNQNMSDVLSYKISTRFRVNFPYGIVQVIKAIKIHPAFTVQYKSNMSATSYDMNITDYFVRNAKINTKLYKSCRLFSIKPKTNSSKDSSNKQCYTSNANNYGNIISFLEYYHNKYHIFQNDSTKNFTLIKNNIDRFIRNINDFDNSVGSLSFPCRLHGFSPYETNISSQYYFDENVSEENHLLFKREKAPFKININTKNVLPWSNIYDVSVFMADDLTTQTGYKMDTSDALNMNKKLFSHGGLEETLFESELINLEHLDMNNMSFIDNDTIVRSLCKKTLDMFNDDKNPNLFSQYYKSNDNMRPIVLLEPTSVWISVEIVLPTQTKLSNVISTKNNFLNLSNVQLDELVLVTVKFPTWKPDYEIIKQHQNVFGSNDYIFQNVVSIFDCNSFFFKHGNLVYSPFYLSEDFREFQSQAISSIDTSNFYGLSWNYLQIYSHYDSTIYDERGFETCYQNYSHFFQPTKTGVGSRGLFSYIPTQGFFFPIIAYNIYATQYNINQVGLNYDILSPDLYHPIILLNSSDIISQGVIVNFTVPTFNISGNYTNNTKTPISNMTTTGVTDINPESYNVDIDDDILDHYNVSVIEPSTTTTGKNTDIFKGFRLSQGIDTGWSAVVIAIMILSVLLFICYIRARSKNNSDGNFNFSDDEFTSDYDIATTRTNKNTCRTPNLNCLQRLSFSCNFCKNYDDEGIQSIEEIPETPVSITKTQTTTENDDDDDDIDGDRVIKKDKTPYNTQISTYEIVDDNVITVDPYATEQDESSSDGSEDMISRKPNNPLLPKKKQTKED